LAWPVGNALVGRRNCHGPVRRRRLPVGLKLAREQQKPLARIPRCARRPLPHGEKGRNGVAVHSTPPGNLNDPRFAQTSSNKL
jgi:hypothetical protein